MTIVLCNNLITRSVFLCIWRRSERVYRNGNVEGTSGEAGCGQVPLVPTSATRAVSHSVRREPPALQGWVTSTTFCVLEVRPGARRSSGRWANLLYLTLRSRETGPDKLSTCACSSFVLSKSRVHFSTLTQPGEISLSDIILIATPQVLRGESCPGLDPEVWLNCATPSITNLIQSGKVPRN